MSFEKKEQNEVKIFGCVFSLVIIQGKLIRRVMTPISRTYIFDKSTDDFFMKFYRTRETDGSAGQTFDLGSQGQIVTLSGQHADGKRVSSARNSRQVSSVRGPKV